MGVADQETGAVPGVGIAPAPGLIVPCITFRNSVLPAPVGVVCTSPSRASLQRAGPRWIPRRSCPPPGKSNPSRPPPHPAARFTTMNPMPTGESPEHASKISPPPSRGRLGWGGCSVQETDVVPLNDFPCGKQPPHPASPSRGEGYSFPAPQTEPSAIRAAISAHSPLMRRRIAMPSRRNAAYSRPRNPWTSRARRLRSNPSTVRGPVDLPPCRRQRLFFMAGWPQPCPARVRAPQRRARRKSPGGLPLRSRPVPAGKRLPVGETVAEDERVPVGAPADAVRAALMVWAREHSYPSPQMTTAPDSSRSATTDQHPPAPLNFHIWIYFGEIKVEEIFYLSY